MKLKKIVSVVLAAICLASLSCVNIVTVFANSAQTYWEGVEQSGAIITEGDSPIVVEKELLTFDLQEFPKNYYDDVDDFLSYNGKVTAEYTFFNPSDMVVTAKLLFPFGCKPHYSALYDPETGMKLDVVDVDKYDILINGAAVEKTVRHTLSSFNDWFSLKDSLGILHDDFMTDSFFSPELTVTRYMYKDSGVDRVKYQAATVGFDVPKGIGSYRMYYPGQNGSHVQNDGDLRIQGSVNKPIELYVFGTPLSQQPEWKVYKDGAVRDSDVIDGEVTLYSTQTTTFKEFVLANWDEQKGVFDYDWYNAAVNELISSSNKDYPMVNMDRHRNSFDGYLMRWYEYEISIGEGDRIVNTVTAPVYPSIDLNYNPDVFGYTYLLSPAKTWKNFGELNIVVNTPYYMTKSSVGDFTKTESGYTLTLNGLPDGELLFNLSTGEAPYKETHSYERTEWTIPVIAIALVIGVGITIAVIVYYKRKSNKQ